ncbi:MAG: hypothetical protein QE271_07235 [Bacteriovoracaceae bacterium]|nr:hypothetical protein [Bacteriovoracaceae bacterium]
MSFLLQFLLSLITFFGWFTAAVAYGLVPTTLSHILLAVPFVIVLIFVLAFVMFYFMGVRQLVVNVMHGLQTSNREQLGQFFSCSDEEIPKDLTPYLSKLNRFYYVVNQAKRKSIPWCILILILGILAFLLGAAHHTQVVDKSIHLGVVIGYLVASTLGWVWMMKYLREANKTLRQVKELFGLKSNQM